MWAVLLLRPYLENTKYTLKTDNDSLKWTINLIDGTERLESCHLILFEYDLDILCLARIKLHSAEALSRLQTTRTDHKSLENDLPTCDQCN